MKERGIEIKVGILVLVSLTILIGLIFLLGDINFGDKGMIIYVDFRTSAHLKSGAPVMINGVPAGKVKDIDYWGGGIDPELKDHRKGTPVWIRVKLKLDAKMGATIRRNARFVITTKGVLGEKYIEITPGSIEQAKIKSGDKMEGTDLPAISDLMMNLSKVGESARRVLANVDRTLQKNPELLGKILRNANSALENASKMIVEVRMEVKPMIVRVKRSLKKVDQILERADKALVSVNYSLNGGKDIRVALANVRQITVTVRSRVRRMLDRVDTFVAKGNKMADTGNQILASVQKDVPILTGDLKEILRRGKSVVTKVDSGKGTIAQFLNEEELYEIVKETMKNLKRHPWKLIWKQ